MKKTIQLTDEGYQELLAELEELKSQRSAIADRIAEARDFGDLKENAEYDAARTDQTAVETRIAEIEDIMSKAEVIGEGNKNVVHLGSTVKIRRLLDKKEFSYTVVGSIEADPSEGKISDESPMGVGLLDRKIGEIAQIKAPKGLVEYEILSIQ